MRRIRIYAEVLTSAAYRWNGQQWKHRDATNILIYRVIDGFSQAADPFPKASMYRSHFLPADAWTFADAHHALPQQPLSIARVGLSMPCSHREG